MKRMILPLLISMLSAQLGLYSLAAEKAAQDPAEVVPKAQQWEEVANPAPVLGAHDTVLLPAFPDKQWWQKFNDPNLTNYINTALKNNPNLRAAVIRIAEARAIMGQNIAQQRPSLNLNPSYYHVGFPKNTLDTGSSSGNAGGFNLPSKLNLFNLPFQAAFEVDLFGKYRDQTKAAQKQLESTEEDSRAAEIALTGDVTTAYFNLVREDALVQSQQRNLDLLTRIYQLRQSQNKIGLASFDDVIRADRDVALAQTNLTTYQQQQALYAHQLSVLTGSPPAVESHLVRTALDDVVLPQQTASGIPSELITRRPDIISRERQLERAKLDVKVARKAFLPTVNLGALLGFAGMHFGDIFKFGNPVTLESVTVGQPLYRGGNLHSTLNLRRAQQEEQLANYQQTILTAFREVEDNISLLRADYENLDSNTHRLQLTEHDLRLTENLYQQGLSPHIDVLQAQSELVQYQQLNFQSKMDAAIATVNLYKALGGGY